MTSTQATNMTPPRADTPLLGKTGMVWVAVFGILFIVLHFHIFRRMGLIGINDGDWSHILVIPFISIYYIYINRERILAQPRRVCLWGLPLMVAGIFGFALGIIPLRNDMAQGYSMIMGLFGLLLLLFGPRVMRVLWFPVVFLVFGIKISPAFWSVIAAKMQFIAAHGAVVLINLLSPLTEMHADIRGSTIDLDYIFQGKAEQTPLNVAEACSGLRMLMAFLALGVALAFLFPRRWWQRAVMILLAAPIAIFVNVLRVTILSLLYLYDPTFAQGQFHIFIGMLMLIPAAGLLMLVGWCLEKAVIGRPDDTTPPPIPPKHDPEQFVVEWAPVRKGLFLGIATMLGAGLAYLFLLNHVADGVLSEKLVSAWPKALNVVGLVLMVGGLGALAFMLRRLLGSPGTDQRWYSTLGLALGVLLTAAVGHVAINRAMGVVMIKDKLPLRYNLTAEFPKKAGNWVMLSQDGRLPPDVEHTLEANEYFTRWYIDTTGAELEPKTEYGEEIDGAWLLFPDDGSATQELRLIQDEDGSRTVAVAGAEPGQVAKLHIAYYTGLVDTVPHVPDKCWLASGASILSRSRHSFPLEGENYRDDPDSDGLLAMSAFGYEVRVPTDEVEMIIFAAQAESDHRITAAYFFMANGRQMASSHQTRFSFSLRDRYAYYCKVEVMFPGLHEPAEVEQRAREFFTDMMPQIMAVLPDWTEVQQGRYLNADGTPAAPPPAVGNDTDDIEP